MKLSAAQRARIRRACRPRELSPDEEGGELNVVPFLDIITNIMIFVLATVAVTFTATITTSPPASKGSGVRKNIESTALNLTVIIVNEGFSIKATGGNVAQGCATVGPGLAIPKKNGKFDFVGLNQCVARLKKSGDFENETQAFISANPGTPYQDVINVADALRSTPQGDALFEQVNFKVPR